MLISLQDRLIHRLSLFSALLFFPMVAMSQNLIPNHSFEQVRANATCERPDVAFVNVSNWYSLNATPDFFQASCDFNDNEFVFWDSNVKASEGFNFAGLWSRWNSDETYKTEGISVEISESLAPGETYELSFKVLNKGEFQGLTASCIMMPRKHIDIYLSEDSIKIVNNFSNGTASTDATKAAIIRSQEISGDGTEDWTTVSTCFTAQGGERFIGIILPLGDFGDLPPCAASMGTSGVFRSFYYLLDEVNLEILSTDLRKDTLICEGEVFAADLHKIFPEGILDQASFEWDDGGNEAFRNLDENRKYEIVAVTNCGNIPLELTINSEACSSNIYVPNIFDPTSSDINSQLRPLNIDLENISNYQFNIYDRWGSRLFSSSDPTQGWTGISQNQETPQGSYIWQFTFDTIELNQSVRKQDFGTFTLIR